MAISPGVPTSFVPKQPVRTPTRKTSAGNNIFLLASLAVLGVSIIAAGAVFGYSQFLAHDVSAKAAEVQNEQNSVDTATVQDYIRLQNRFASGESLLDNHILLSNFFNELEKVTLQDVQFTSLTLTVAGDGSAKITVDGIAKNFNALAVQSNAVAADTAFKQAIFSGIAFDTGGRIKFVLTADIDPALIHMTEKQAMSSPAPVVTSVIPQTPQPVGTSTATSTL